MTRVVPEGLPAADSGSGGVCRKHHRKWRKRLAEILKQIGEESLHVTSTPHQWILLSGFGTRHNHSQETIKALFQDVPPVEVKLFPNASFCFLRMESNEQAEKFWKIYNASEAVKVKKDETSGSGTPYVSYIENPESLKIPVTPELQPYFSPPPPGLRVIPNFLNKSEGETLLQAETAHVPSQQLAQRFVKHYGYDFRYGTNDVNMSLPSTEKIPEHMQFAVQKIIDAEVYQTAPEQVTVNHYFPGQGIPPHCDTHSCFGDTIAVISLGSPVVMEFQRGHQFYSTVVPPNSLMIMEEEVRYGWTHTIRSRLYDHVPLNQDINQLDVCERGLRLSVTFRTLKRSLKCECSFPEKCDTQKDELINKVAPELEDIHVHKVYETIAEHFDDTRQTPWPKVKAFLLEAVEEGGAVLDVGCGNGKYFNINLNTFHIGCDMSLPLLEICREKKHEVLKSNALILPFRDETFSAAICIAVLHHLSTPERRLEVIKQIYRLLRPNGAALITVWSKDQQNSVWANKQEKSLNSSSGGISQPSSTLPGCSTKAEFGFLPVHTKNTNFKEKDMLVPWKDVTRKQPETFLRYYHLFEKNELSNLIRNSDLHPTPKVTEDFDEGNYVVTITKPSCSSS